MVDKLPTNWLAGFLNHQQYDIFLFATLQRPCFSSWFNVRALFGFILAQSSARAAHVQQWAVGCECLATNGESCWRMMSLYGSNMEWQEALHMFSTSMVAGRWWKVTLIHQGSLNGDPFFWGSHNANAWSYLLQSSILGIHSSNF